MDDEGIAPIHTGTADPVAMDRKSCLYTILEYSVQARLSAHADWINCMYLAQLPRLPFCGLIYIPLLHLCHELTLQCLMNCTQISVCTYSLPVTILRDTVHLFEDPVPTTIRLSKK